MENQENTVTEKMFVYPGDETDPIDAFLAEPVGEGPFPSVVVIMEAFGVVEHIKDIARSFAREGYIAIAPELYSREGPPDPNNLSTVGPKMFAAPDKRVINDLEGAVAFLKSLPTSNGKVGTIGFCSGGRQSLMFACRSTNINAAVDCYGGFIVQEELTAERPTAPIYMTSDLSCPLLGLFGDEDQNPSPFHIALLKETLENHGKEFEFHSYPGAGHGFFADYRPSYNAEVAHDAWQQVLTWYSKYLC